MRASGSFGHSGRPAALCAPRCVARRDTKNLPNSSGFAVAMSSTRGWPGAHRFAASPVQVHLALGPLDLVSATVSSSARRRLGRLRRNQLQRRRELRARRHGLQRLGQRRVAAGVERDVDPAPGRARLRVAEHVLRALPAAEHAAHHRHRAGARASAHARHAEPRERRDVDPRLRHRRLHDLGRALARLRACHASRERHAHSEQRAVPVVHACPPRTPMRSTRPTCPFSTGRRPLSRRAECR